MCLHDRRLDALWIGTDATGRRSANLLDEEREENTEREGKEKGTIKPSVFMTAWGIINTPCNAREKPLFNIHQLHSF